MDSGVAALLGSAIGGLSGVVVPVLNEYLKNRREHRLADIRKETLRKILSNPKFRFRRLSTLNESVGLDDDETVALLLEIGARKNRAKGSDQWGLISRNPWPNDDQSTEDTSG
jgi:hypothetical protein